jgi:hypothetical protein
MVEKAATLLGMDTCAKCTRPLSARARTGRPARYCSPACRRAAEYELRRVQRHLEMVERELRLYRVKSAETWIPPVERRSVPALEAEAERLECRLRELLSDEQVKAVPA